MDILFKPINELTNCELRIFIWREEIIGYLAFKTNLVI